MGKEINLTSKVKVLVVDDDDAIRSLLASELEDQSFDVQSAEDGDEAIELVRAMCERDDRFDIILLDVKMPKVNGFDVLKYVRKETPTTKVIMVTAYADVRNAVDSMRFGAFDFISKPYDLDEILTSVCSHRIGISPHPGRTST